VILTEVVPKCQWTLRHQCRKVLGPKCLRSEVSVHHDTSCLSCREVTQQVEFGLHTATHWFTHSHSHIIS